MATPHFKIWSTKTNDNEMFPQRFERSPKIHLSRYFYVI